jgi:hypothetical protein
MKYLASFLLISILAGCASVTGVVRDKPTGTPISSATINVNRSSTTTDAVGHYKLMGSFVRGDTLMVNAPGYNMYTHTLRDFNEIVDIELTPKNHN